MNNERKLTAEQQQLVNELVKAYGIEPDQVLFYNEKPDPFFTYEAVCALCNQLTDLAEISVETIPSPFANSIAARCTLVSENGRRSAEGFANISQTINGEKMTEPQLLGLASSRAMRNALKLANINLFTAHKRAQTTGEITSASEGGDNYRNALIGQAHALGGEAGLIFGSDKRAWRRQMAIRYGGIESSKDLSEAQLLDWIAFLRTLVPASNSVAANNAALAATSQRG